MKLLLVAAEVGLVKTLGKKLRAAGFVVFVAGSGTDGLRCATEGTYDVMILDVGLPGSSGGEVLRRMRAHGVRTPVMMLATQGGDVEQSDAFGWGADDYVTKPFSFEVLVARLRALVRRGDVRARPAVLHSGSLTVDPGRRWVQRGSTPISLTPREYELLEYLMRRAGSIVTKAEILHDVWDPRHSGSDNVVEVYVRYLRRKIDVPFGTASIQTVRGFGYRLASGRPSEAGPESSARTRLDEDRPGGRLGETGPEC